MSYGVAVRGERYGFLKRVRIKTGKAIAGRFPANSVRIYGLRLCGFTVGRDVYIGPGLVIASLLSESGCTLIIGDRVAIAPGVILTLSSDANWSRLNRIIEPERGTIKLCDDSWLGAGVIVMPGVTIGECSVAGAGSVVTADIPPFSVYAGVPAKLIRTLDKEML